MASGTSHAVGREPSRAGYPAAMGVHRWLRTAEDVSALDRQAAALSAAVRRIPRSGRWGTALRGSWLGHPLHPLMVTVPIGAWLSAGVLDATGDAKAARTLVGVGLAAASPTILLGLADYADLDQRQRRIGLLHAAINTVALACFAASYGRRRAGGHGSGKLCSLLGLLTLSAGGAFGAHLSYAQGAGVYRWQSPTELAPHPAPSPAANP
jgi:hypothetical protein